VTEADLSILLSLYGTRDPRADYNFDGIVDTADSLLFTEHLGHRCMAFMRGDVDGNGDRDQSDIDLNLCGQFAGCELTCLDAADVNDDGEITITDIVRSLCSGGTGCDRPPDPYWGCGPDQTEDDLGCGCPNICMPCDQPILTVGEAKGYMDYGGSLERALDRERIAGDLAMTVGPNPAARSVSISYRLHVGSRVRVVIYDVAGKVVSTLVAGYRSAGNHYSNWDGRDHGGRLVPNGVYFCRVMTPVSNEMHKIVLLR
jgi:hypothetical protein